MWKSALQILQMPEESPSLVRVYLSTTSWSTPLLTSFLWCDLNAISLPAIRSTPKFSKFLWEQFRFFFEVKVSSEIPQWNKYTMRSYASRQNVCDVPYSRGQWVQVLLGLRCALTSTIFPRRTGTDRSWVFVNLTYVPTRHERPVWIMISIHCAAKRNYFLHGIFYKK